MNITKDEAAILAHVMNDAKYELCKKGTNSIEEVRHNIEAYANLEERLDTFSLDKRRFGRTSRNDFSDALKRFINKYYKNESNKNLLQETL